MPLGELRFAAYREFGGVPNVIVDGSLLTDVARAANEEKGDRDGRDVVARRGL